MSRSTVPQPTPRGGGRHDGVFRVTEAASKARFGVSRLPPAAPRLHHFLNNLASAPDTGLLHVGRGVSCVAWGNEHARVHWLDEGEPGDVARPDVAPYTLVVADRGAVRPRMLSHHADALADEFVLAVPGWATSSSARAKVRRELGGLHRWDVVMRVELFDPAWTSDDWDGVFVAVLRTP